ncbi:TRAP transporter substrate-binding protein [Ramlibacter montanisoli]|uniref:TRAP transporter substrate-binding protein n=1 Tax=Ramlibacter montanisoli TaxID=2732512 RepID=A0A849K8X1_9BURK|nr:TRAP transporter substrate-binding protein [Ramlibacter montanisoli]NNU44832.1 TRAP transporter substrate-binding protein [Ramlibacter montanisoli]
MTLRLPSKMLAVAALAAALVLPAAAQDRIKFKAIGQPLATGLIQKNKEQPFFENFAQRTGLPIDVDYKPIDTLGVKDTEQLRVMKAGLFDIVSLRVSQNSRDEPTLLGLDLVGASPDYATGRKVANAYFSTIDERLQKQFNVKLLGVWPFGPQVLFCKKPIAKLADVKGMKVRVYDQNLAKFIEMVGGTPVPVSFADTHQSLSLGVVDCAITGPSSANSAGWPEVTTHQLPLGFQMALNGYAISLKAWNQLKPDQQAKLKTAFDGLTSEIWTYSEELFQDALNCNQGKDPCTTGKKFKLTNVAVSPADLELVRGAVTKVSLPVWAEVCDKSNADCSKKWNATVAPVLGLK